MFFGSGQFPREFYESMEKMFVEKMNEMIRNPEFLSKFSKVMGTGLEGKKKMDDMSREYLEKMHLPTRQDVAHVLQYLQQIESRIIQVEEKIEDLSDSLKNSVREPRPSKVPAKPVKKHAGKASPAKGKSSVKSNRRRIK